MVDIPVLFSKTKPKSFSFATNITSIFKNFEESEQKNLNLSKPILLTNDFDSGKENMATNKPSAKRSREESTEEENLPNKVAKKSCQEPPETEDKTDKPKKTTFNDANFRRLNMKTFKSKGYRGGTSKGTKFKRFQWSKNKNKNKLNAKYGVGLKLDDESETVNYNLLCDETEEKETLVQEEVIDEMSAEAQFAKLNKNNDHNSKSTQKKAKNPKDKNQDTQNNEIQNSEEAVAHDEDNEKKTKKSIIKIKKSPKKKTNKVNKNENKEIDPEVKTSKAKSTRKPKKVDEELNDDICRQIIEDDDEIEMNQFIADENSELSDPKPLFSVDEQGNVPERLPDFAYKVLEKDFGHKNFKKNQEEAIIRILCGQSALAILSTGYGKSLIYQFAALMYARKYPGSIVLVVSPLISLMQDQLHNLTKSLKAASCDSTLTEKEFEFLVQDINNGKINILYMSPEAIINKKIKSLPRLAFVCIDEVHCLSQWSHNFRPSYLQLCQILFDFYNAKCILGLTATATDSSIEEIRGYFDIDKRNIIKDCDLPENLNISITKDNNKEQALIELLKSPEFKPFFNHVIIYCSRREQTERLAQLLRLSLHSYKKSFNLDKYSKMEKKSKESAKELKKMKKEEDGLNEDDIAESYHAGLTTQQRKRIQNRFIKGKLKIIVATLAFGMGINMPNIRAVIHYNMPKSIENYVQEIGRAGRDGKNSICHLFLENQREDINEIKKYIHMSGYDQLTIKKLLAKIFDTCSEDKCSEKNSEFNHHVALPIPDMVDLLDVKEETILTLLCYLEAAKYLKIMSNCFKTCTIKSYKGIDYLKQLAKTNDFVALILEQHNKNSKSSANDDEIRVDLIELCEATKAKIFDTCSEDKCSEKNSEFNHHVALPIPDMVDLLDVKEETILTLLCYLEAAKYLKIMSNCFKTCTIKSYKGIDYLKQLAKTNDVVALILEQHNKNSKSSANDDEIRVDLNELCEATKGEYDFIRQKLRRLEWQLDDCGNYKSKSGIQIVFGNQSFYVKRKCIMNDSELDNINEMLWSRVDTQMKFSYANFKSLYKMLSEQSYKNIGGFIYNFDVKTEQDISNAESVMVNCDEENDDSDSECKLRLESDSDSEEKNEEEKLDKQISKDEINNENRVTFKSKLLKEKLNQYFNNKFDIADYAKDYDFNCDSGVSSLSREQEMKRLVADIRKFIFTYQSDIKLNGTIIARIFHGIGTPRYPAEIWGRNRIFWRCHLDFDFENIVKVATDQLLNL